MSDDRFPFPPLPNSQLSPQTHAAYHWIHDIHRHAVNILVREDPDPLRLSYHLQRVMDDILPILRALENDLDEELPKAWLHSCTDATAKLVVGLASAIAGAEGKYVFSR